MKIHNYDTELDELLDCPFCGGRPIAYLKGNERMRKRSITIKCSKCLIQRTQAVIHHSTQWLEDKCIELWNSRTNLTPYTNHLREVE